MTLEQAWHLLELLNEDANQKSKDLWTSNNITEAICQQSACFRKNLLELDNNQQQLIKHWINHDDELHDYFNCLAGNE